MGLGTPNTEFDPVFYLLFTVKNKKKIEKQKTAAGVHLFTTSEVE